MTVRELIERLQKVRNQDAFVCVVTQLSTDFEDCIVNKVADERADFDADSDGAVWLRYSGQDYADREGI